MEEVHDTDTLNMEGDWTLTYGYNVGFTDDGAGHFLPVGSVSTTTFKVRFGPGKEIDHGAQFPAAQFPGAQFKGVQFPGRYLPESPPHHPDLEQPGALMAETLYAGRGVVVVQLIEHVAAPGTQYFGVLSGHHQHYRTGIGTDPRRDEIVGGWCNVGTAPPEINTNSSKGTFTLVRITPWPG